MRSAYLIFILIFLSLSAFAQKADSSNYNFIGFEAHYGFIIPHAAAIEPVSHTKPYGFDVSLNRLHTSFEKWKVFNHYNISGFEVSYFNFQNPAILGNAFLLTVYNESILGYSKNFIFSLKGGLGLSYQTRIYDWDNNQLNKFFSTRISFPLYLITRFKYKINRQTYLTLSGSYNHISNGGIRLPNYGMNFPTVTMGIEYFQKPIPQLSKLYIADRGKKVTDQIFLVHVLTGYRVVYSKQTYALGLNTRYSWQLRTHYGLNAGAEIIMDEGVKELIRIEGLNLDYKRIAITAGQDFIFGKVVFTQYFGLYIYSPYKARNIIYQKYELSYKVIPQFMFGIYLKAYTSNAELFGLCFDYLLNRK